MNPVEIEQSLSEFFEKPFNAETFPFEFLACFGRNQNELKSLRSGNTNKSDIKGAYLLRNSIHILICSKGKTSEGLEFLKTKSIDFKLIILGKGTEKNEVKFFFEKNFKKELIHCGYVETRKEYCNLL